MFCSHRGYQELEEKKLYSLNRFLASDSSACFSERVVRVEIPEGESTVVARRHADIGLQGFAKRLGGPFV
jgi:hypothetical protein